MQLTTRKRSLLANAVLGNAIFSAVSGLTMALAAAPLTRFIGLPSPLILTVTGVVLIGYAGVLNLVAASGSVPTAVGWAAIVLDVAWVVGSIMLVLLDPLAFSVGGKWLIAILADIVAVFAIVQYLGVRRQQA